MDMDEKAIRCVVSSAVDAYAAGFSDRHVSEANDPEGTINMKIHNVFIAALGKDIQYYSALARSLDSSLGNMLEKMAINIAKLNYTVEQSVEGYMTTAQTNFIAELLEKYKTRNRVPMISDYQCISELFNSQDGIHKVHASDYYLYDAKCDLHVLIELKIGGDLDNKKSRSEKEAILEQYAILKNKLPTNSDIKIYFATAYNRFGENKEWRQERVLQFFSKEELLIGKDFWNFICKSTRGYEIVLDEYRNNAFKIVQALEKIKQVYL